MEPDFPKEPLICSQGTELPRTKRYIAPLGEVNSTDRVTIRKPMPHAHHCIDEYAAEVIRNNMCTKYATLNDLDKLLDELN